MTHRRVLVVDDEPGLREVLRDLLETEGYTVTACESVPEAERALDDECFDVAMVDVFLNNAPAGIDLAGTILAERAETRVILMTGYADHDDVESACLRGAYTCISKPFALEDVVRALDQAEALSAPESRPYMR